jgi:hypothetical protein
MSLLPIKMGNKHKNKPHHGNTPDKHIQPSGGCRYEPRSLYPVRIEPTTEDRQWQFDQKCYWGKQLSVAKWLNYITAGAAVGAFIYAWIAYLQWHDARINFFVDQRAWVTTSAHQPVFSEGNPLQFVLTIGNTGKTPAIHIQKATSYKFTQSPIHGPSPDDIKNLKFEPIGYVPPQGSKQMIITNVAAKDVFKPLQEGSVGLFFFRELRYDDIFGAPHSTTFCVYYMPHINGTEGSSMNYCDEGNSIN